MTDSKLPPGAALVAQRWAVRGELVCAYCGKHFEGRVRRKGPRYCPAGSCREIEAGRALGSQCVCGAPDCQFARSGSQ